MIDFELLKKIILEHKSFLLTTHINPDADAIGSEVAFYYILKELGKEVHIVNFSDTPYNLEFLDRERKIEKFDFEKHSALFNNVDVLVALDFNRSNRIVKMRDSFESSTKLKICIDHHQDPDNFVNYFFNDSQYCATGHIIYNLIEKTNIVKLNLQTAYPIYAAIMTDTGSFRFGRTTPDIHKIAAKLLLQGVKPEEVFDKLYDQSKFSKVKLLGKTLDSLQLYGDKNQIGYMKITCEDFEVTEAVESDTENFVNFSLSIEGVRIGLLFVELREGFKVSFRSKGQIPVNKLAAEFGGGGHTNAAGARIFEHTLIDLLPQILKKTENYLDK
ncbi:MAG: DHH family phosphoesterase [Ignavibacteriaceae bacterium]